MNFNYDQVTFPCVGLANYFALAKWLDNSEIDAIAGGIDATGCPFSTDEISMARELQQWRKMLIVHTTAPQTSVTMDATPLQEKQPMSLDVSLKKMQLTDVFTANITHNLCAMAAHAGIYKAMWRPDEMDPPITEAPQLIPLLESGLAKLKARPDFYRVYDAPNGWGKYENLVAFVEKYLAACIANPDAVVVADR